MIGAIGRYFRRSPSAADACAGVDDELRSRRRSVFLSITVGYGFYYVCRLSFNIARKPLADAGIFDAAQLGVIGSALFFAYAAGKLVNGVLADRVNVRRFMATGLLMSAAINIALGFTESFWVFAVLWGLNGWFQSFGAPSSVVAISQWYDDCERGTWYGLWSSSHNIGEAVTFIGTAFVIDRLGWFWGFRLSGVVCLLVALIVWRRLYERPDVYGLPVVEHSAAPGPIANVTAQQWAVFRNPAVWVLALASAFFYVTRYAVNSWGIFFLEAAKGYTSVEASLIVSANAVAGIAGTLASGVVSDRLFGGRRNGPALLFGVLYTVAIAWFVLAPANLYTDVASMILFGLALGVLLVYLGGLMAVDLCPRAASGTALGLVGIASYLGAGIQDIVSGRLVSVSTSVASGEKVFDFHAAGWFWIGAAAISTLLATFAWRPTVGRTDA